MAPQYSVNKNNRSFQSANHRQGQFEMTSTAKQAFALDKDLTKVRHQGKIFLWPTRPPTLDKDLTKVRHHGKIFLWPKRPPTLDKDLPKDRHQGKISSGQRGLRPLTKT